MRNGALRGGDGACGPYIVAVDDDQDARERVVGALERRYGMDYRIVGHASSDQALDALGRLRDDGEEVALILADQWMPQITGAELLARANEGHPLAKRCLLIDWGAWGHEPTAEAILGAMGRGEIDYYLPKPWGSRDELFHRGDGVPARVVPSRRRDAPGADGRRPAALSPGTRADRPARPQRRPALVRAERFARRRTPARWLPTSGSPTASPRRPTISSASTTAQHPPLPAGGDGRRGRSRNRDGDASGHRPRLRTEEAGFGRFEVLPIENDFYRFYRLAA